MIIWRSHQVKGGFVLFIGNNLAVLVSEKFSYCVILRRTKRLPVLHIFGREPIDVDSCATAFRRLFPDMESHVLMMCDTVYAYCLGEPLLIRVEREGKAQCLLFCSVCHSHFPFKVAKEMLVSVIVISYWAYAVIMHLRKQWHIFWNCVGRVLHFHESKKTQ